MGAQRKWFNMFELSQSVFLHMDFAQKWLSIDPEIIPLWAEICQISDALSHIKIVGIHGGSSYRGTTRHGPRWHHGVDQQQLSYSWMKEEPKDFQTSNL